ncbi:MAG: hypothetical protein AAF385_15105 [Pseudomonadota bacterium]
MKNNRANPVGASRKLPTIVRAVQILTFMVAVASTAYFMYAMSRLELIPAVVLSFISIAPHAVSIGMAFFFRRPVCQHVVAALTVLYAAWGGYWTSLFHSMEGKEFSAIYLFLMWITSAPVLIPGWVFCIIHEYRGNTSA